MAPAAAPAASAHPHPVGTPKFINTQPLAASYDPAHCQQPSPPPDAAAGPSGGRPSGSTNSGSTSSLPAPPPSLRHLSPSMIAGAGAGLVSSIVTCPLDVVKTRMQAQTKGKGKAVAYDSALSESPAARPSVRSSQGLVGLDESGVGGVFVCRGRLGPASGCQA